MNKTCETCKYWIFEITKAGKYRYGSCDFSEEKWENSLPECCCCQVEYPATFGCIHWQEKEHD